MTLSDVLACLKVAIAAPDLDILLLIWWATGPITPQLFSLSAKSLVVPDAGAPPMMPLPTPEIATA